MPFPTPASYSNHGGYALHTPTGSSFNLISGITEPTCYLIDGTTTSLDFTKGSTSASFNLVADCRRTFQSSMSLRASFRLASPSGLTLIAGVLLPDAISDYDSWDKVGAFAWQDCETGSTLSMSMSSRTSLLPNNCSGVCEVQEIHAVKLSVNLNEKYQTPEGGCILIPYASIAWGMQIDSASTEIPLAPLAALTQVWTSGVGPTYAQLNSLGVFDSTIADLLNNNRP